MRKRSGKYNAKPMSVDGIRFASKKEGERYIHLKIRESRGEISRLELQPAFPLVINDRPVLMRSAGFPNGRKAKYVADFSYLEGDGVCVVEDVKGMDTPVSRLKRALVEAIYGIRVVVV